MTTQYDDRTMSEILEGQLNKWFVTSDKVLDEALSKLDRTQFTVWQNRTYQQTRLIYRRWQAGKVTDAQYDQECARISRETALRIVKLFNR